MTTQEFMVELQNVSGQFDWKLEQDTGIYASRRKWPRLHIRGTLREGRLSGTVFEPMGAVCYARTGRVFEPGAWARAGDELELLPVRAAELYAAANDRTWAGGEGRREPVEYLQTLRDRLIEAIGLSAPTPPAEARHQG